METLFIYLLKSSGLVTLFFLAYYFYCEKKPFSPVTVGFVGRFDHFRDSAFIGFHEDHGWNQSRNNRLVANSRWYPVEKPL
jgi:hypothetical protein